MTCVPSTRGHGMTTAGNYTETFVEVADVRLQLRQGGTGEPLLVLHGELGVPGWLQAYELIAEHFTVYVPSLPGFGQSAPTGSLACAIWQPGSAGLSETYDYLSRSTSLAAPWAAGLPRRPLHTMPRSLR